MSDFTKRIIGFLAAVAVLAFIFTRKRVLATIGWSVFIIFIIWACMQ